MEVNLRAAYAAVLGSDNTLRKQAEAYLKSLESTQGFLLVNIQVVSQAPNNPQEVAIRQSAAVMFKNVVKKLWAPTEEGDVPIAQSDRDAIKTHLVTLMCSTPPDIQKQLAEVVAVVAKHDFPMQWQTLLPQLVEKLNTTDFRVIQGVMLTANSIFKKFRYSHKSEELMEQLVYCLGLFQSPLLEIFKSAGAALPALANDKDSLTLVLETLRLMARIFFSLNWQDLPEFFEDNISIWMTEFASYLTYQNPLLVNLRESNEPGPIEKLQAAIVENLSLYVTKYEEEFAGHLGVFTQLVWKLCMEVSALPKHDNLATAAIKFLTAVVSKKANAPLFNDAVVREIVESIVIRNLTATEADEELFEDNPTDFIRKDMEGSDQDTRRRCATELVRGLMKFFAGVTSQVCIDYIANMLSQYAASKDWKAKDAALHLVLAVAASSSSVAQGVGELNTHINLVEIFSLHIVPELQDPHVNARPIVKTDAIKLLCMFRNHLDTPMLLALLPDLIRHLSSRYVVIQTYAALTLEKFLALKLKDGPPGAMRITKEHLVPYLQGLFQGLFLVLDNPDLPENDYVMKCVMRLLVVLGPEVAAVTPLVLAKLMQALERVCKNPANPHFNHYMFECIAVLIRSCCAAPATALAACTEFETLLFPPFQSVLSLDVVEFVPYVFQILAELLSYRPVPGLSDPYKVLTQPLLTPVLWERKGNAPALTDLIIAYIRKGMKDIEAAGSVQPLLGVFQKLLSSKTTEKLAVRILNALVACNPINALAPYIPTIWQLLLTKLRESKTAAFPRLFFHALSIFVIHYGASAVYEILEGVSKGVVGNLIAQVWLPQSSAIAAADEVEVKEMLIGAAKLLSESAITQQLELWGQLLKAAVVLLDSKGNEQVELNLLEDEADDRGFDAAYSKLAYCQIPDIENCKEVAQANVFFLSTLSALCRSSPGRYASVIQTVLPENESQVLSSALQSAGLTIV